MHKHVRSWYLLILGWGLVLNQLAQAQVSQHITQLNHKEAAVRLFGAYALGIRGDEKAVHPLLQLLKDPDSNVRLATIDALGEIRSEKALAKLTPLLSHSEATVRAHTADAVVKIVPTVASVKYQITRYEIDIGDPTLAVRADALKALARLNPQQHLQYQQVKARADLQDSTETIRVLGCRDLSQIGSQQAVSSLVAILSDTAVAVRLASLDALQSIAQRLGKEVILEAIDPLLLTLQDQDTTVRHKAGQVFVTIGMPEAGQILDALVTDEGVANPVVVSVMAQIGVPALDLLISKLDAEDATLRMVALQTLEMLQPDQSHSYRVLKSQADLKDPEPSIRANGLKQLGQSGILSDGVTAALSDSDARVRQQAAITVGQIGDTTVEALVPLLSSGNASARWHAIVAVGLIANHLESDARLQATVDPLLDALSDSDSSIRSAATDALKKIGTSALDQIQTRLRSQNRTTRALVEFIATDIAPDQAESFRLRRYLGDLQDRDLSTRMAALLAIRQISDVEAINNNLDLLVNQNLIGYATDTNLNLNLRKSALLTLAETAKKVEETTFLEPSFDTLFVLLEEPNLRPEAAKIISVVGKSAVPNLIRRLQHQDSELRSTITRTLVQIGEPATASLTAALSNPSYLVRRNVAVALSQIDPDHADEFLMKRYINDLRDEDSRVRANGAKLLKVYGNQNAVKPLLTALSDDNYRVRFLAAEALAKIGDKAVIGHLDQARKRKGEIKVVREAMKTAIDHLEILP